VDAGSTVSDFVVSRDDKCIMVGTIRGQVVVCDSITFEKANDFKAHDERVRAWTFQSMGSNDETINVWRFPRGVERLLNIRILFRLALVFMMKPARQCNTSSPSWRSGLDSCLCRKRGRQGGEEICMSFHCHLYFSQLRWHSPPRFYSRFKHLNLSASLASMIV
jgi:hypothetical protein